MERRRPYVAARYENTPTMSAPNVPIVAALPALSADDTRATNYAGDLAQLIEGVFVRHSRGCCSLLHCAWAKLAGQAGMPGWQARLTSQAGRPSWPTMQAKLASQASRPGWQSRLAVQTGKPGWQARLAGHVGRPGWQARRPGQAGRPDWQC